MLINTEKKKKNLKLKVASKYYAKQNIHKIDTILEQALFQFYYIKCWSSNKQNRMMNLLKALSKNKEIFCHFRSSDPDHSIMMGPTKKEFLLPYKRLRK
jgi:adenine specific DNA methylase Mod